MASAFITYSGGVGPSGVQAPSGKISDATPLAISASAASTPAVTQACLAEISTDTTMQLDWGPNVTATTTTGQRIPAGAFGYFKWLNVGDRISVIAQT